MKSIEDRIQEFVEDELTLIEYSKPENGYYTKSDVQYTIKLGKRINKNLEIILRAEEGIRRFFKLLSHDNADIRFLLARYLYPLYPKMTLGIMKTCAEEVVDELQKHQCENVIKGFQNRQQIFMEQFKKLYGVDDLSVLNRENENAATIHIV